MTVRNIALLLYRVVVGFLFFCHGASSVFGWFGGAMGSGHIVPVGEWPGWWAALIQLVVGLLVMGGLFTRWAAVIGSGSMAFAFFTVHVEKALLPIQNGGEPSVLFCWSLLLIAVLGGGAFALDNARTRTAAAHETTALEHGSPELANNA